MNEDLSNVRLVIVRGAPGSGKTAFAKSLEGFSLVGADQYFTDEHGVYQFERDKLHDAHAWCFNMADALLESGNRVVVSNTFTRTWEIEPYIVLSEEHDIKVKVFHCTGDFGNTHNVPEDAVERMKANYEAYPGEVDTDEIL